MLVLRSISQNLPTDAPSISMTNLRRNRSLIRKLLEAESHHHLLTALLVAGGTFFVLSWWVRFPVRIILTWDVFALTSILLALGGMLSSGAKARVRDARNQDSGRIGIAISMVAGALTSLFGAGILLSHAKDLSGTAVISPIVLAAGTVALSWFLVHTLLAVHYTHLYYLPSDGRAGESDPGLSFPGKEDPDFIDFAYFSFVIGMTFQVSDVQITGRTMRRTVLIHSLLAFLFNTVILAFSINLATTLL